MDSFLIFDPERSFDESLCHGEADVRATIIGADLKHFKVHRVTLGHIVRDVTEQFVAPEVDEEPEDAPFSHIAWMRRSGAFGR